MTFRALGIAAMVAAGAFAQAGGRIEGRIFDGRTREPLAEVAITATSSELQGTRRTTTDSQGRFALLLLPPGTYTLEVSRERYQAFSQEELHLHDGQTLHLERSLRKESGAGVFETMAPSPGIDAASARAGGIVTTEMMSLVPYGRRRGYEDAATAVPRVYRTAPALGGLQSGSSRPGEIATILDGVDVTSPALRQRGFSLLQDLVQEIDVTTAGGDAEQGMSTGGVFSAITPAGGNALHGSVFGGYSGTRHSEGGGELGGALLHDRLWFHAGLGAAFEESPAGHDADAPYQFAGKLTWLVADDQTLTFASHGNEGTSGVHNFTDASARYAGLLFDRTMQVEATAAAQQFGRSPLAPSSDRLLGKVAATSYLTVLDLQLRLRYGLEVERETVPDYSETRAAAFAEEALTVFGRLTLLAGLRLERDTDRATVDSTPGSHLLPRIAVIYDPAGSGLAKIYASAGRYRVSPPLQLTTVSILDGTVSDQVGGGAQVQILRDIAVSLDYVHAYESVEQPFIHQTHYDAATLSLTKLSTENYFLQASYTLEPGDHPNGFKLDAAYLYEATAKTTAALGLSLRAVQGGPEITAKGRYPWDTQLNLRGTVSFKLSPESTLAVTGDVYNVLDRQVQTYAGGASGPIAARAAARLSF